MMRQNRIVGPVIVLRTIRTTDGQQDLEKQRAHLSWLLDQGIGNGNGLIMAAGGGSEGYFMTEHEWKAQVEMLAELGKGRVATAVGIFELSAEAAARKAIYCDEAGIDFVQVGPPRYNVPTDDEVFYHYKAINDASNIGIIVYNTPWTMPNPGYEFSLLLYERLAELKNIEGVKTGVLSDIGKVVSSVRKFGDRFNFISNSSTNGFKNLLSVPIKLGMTAFIHCHGNVAPRFSLHLWNLWKNNQYDEYDAIILKTYIDPFLTLENPQRLQWPSVGEGPGARAGLEALGMNLGPPFPAQQPAPKEYIDALKEVYKVSGLTDWVDWKEEAFSQVVASV